VKSLHTLLTKLRLYIEANPPDKPWAGTVELVKDIEKTCSQSNVQSPIHFEQTHDRGFIVKLVEPNGQKAVYSLRKGDNEETLRDFKSRTLAVIDHWITETTKDKPNKTVEQRMQELVMTYPRDNDQSITDWSRQRFADELGCSKGAISRTAMWKHLMSVRQQQTGESWRNKVTPEQADEANDLLRRPPQIV
jgi:hypothetical protein